GPFLRAEANTKGLLAKRGCAWMTANAILGSCREPAVPFSRSLSRGIDHCRCGSHTSAQGCSTRDLGETFCVHWYSAAANRFAAVPADLVHLCDPGEVNSLVRIGAECPRFHHVRRAAFWLMG